ncbi:MAG: multicopper oxidase domain-containing protein [Candidatus Eremiobacteraeota bacterium]|nr:multicopper oxidase domain-containing protein [Candidatus Eremiobacteraeota bacterium]
MISILYRWWLPAAVSLATLVAACGSNTSAPSDQASSQPTVRTYYVAADEVTWDYAPSGIDQITGLPFGMMETPYVVRAPHRIGRLYRKAIYREYTDSSFRTIKPRAANDRYLGILGPIIHAEVGDTIKVVFKNNATRPYSMHPHGVLYKKDSEGVAYRGSTSAERMGGAVPPGATYTYTWEVPERAGPGPNDPSSVVWFYHSHVDDQKDTESGLIGAIVVTARGMARPDGTPKDVDREFVTLFDIFNENQSWYLQHNIDTYAPLVKGPIKAEAIPLDEQGAFTLNGSGFVDTNFKFTINGYLYGNGPLMTMKKGDRVRWYVLAFGNGFNFHTPHWHGNTVLAANQRTDVLNLAPAQMMTVDMVPDNPGTWLYHCHVSDHMHAGMSALYQVDP